MSAPSKPKRDPDDDYLLRETGATNYPEEDEDDVFVTKVIMIVGCLIALVLVLALGWWITGLVSAPG